MNFKKLNVFNIYKEHIKQSIIPESYSHSVKMNIEIKKGQQEGTALIPCTIYAMDHSIDLNPALIRKKDRKQIKMFKPGKKIEYNSNDYVVELTEDEKKKGYRLRELERCKHCGQKIVIAEVKQTRYRSCPSISVKLADKAKEDVIVPVQFGVNKSDITVTYWIIPIVIGACILATAILYGWKIPTLTIPASNHISLPSWIIPTLFSGFVWLYFIPKLIYKNWMLLRWYHSVKHTLTKNQYDKTVKDY